MKPIFSDILQRNARDATSELALKAGQRSFSHQQHFWRIQQLAASLSGIGVGFQDRICVLAMNSSEYLEIYGAAQWAGFIVNPLNFRLVTSELKWIISDADPNVLIFEAQYRVVVEALRSDLPNVKSYVCIGDEGEVPDWAHRYDDFLDAGVISDGCSRGRATDSCCLIYTSGTTGRPKGVLHSNASIGRLAEVISSELGLTGGDKLLVIAPLFHVGAASLSWAVLFRAGAVVLQRSFDPESVLSAIQHERITVIHLVPTMVQALLDYPTFDQYDLSSLRVLMYAAAPMPLPLLKRAVSVFGPILYNGYGQTEINMLTLLRPHQHNLNGSSQQVKRLESVGQPHWQCQIRVVDEDGRQCAPGEIGEVCAKSETAMSGYWNNSAATLKTLVDGWILTGDVGYLDDENYLFLVDRKKDVIISGGENIYSREVEDVLMSCPSVREAAVIGILDPKWGEVVKAVVVIKSGESLTAEDLVLHCRKQLAAFKCPKSVVFLNELPRLNTGKVSKLELRKRFSSTN